MLLAVLAVCGIIAIIIGALYLRLDTRQLKFISESSFTPKSSVVQNLIAYQSDPCEEQYVTLMWTPPENCMSFYDDFIGIKYHICYRQQSAVATLYYNMPPQSQLSATFKCSTNLLAPGSLQPFMSYVFEVRAERQNHKFGKWRSVELYVKSWICRYPPCKKKKIIMENKILYDYCCLLHKIECDLMFCIYPDCSKNKVWKYQHFCKEHFVKAIIEGMSFLVHVKWESEEYKGVVKEFKKSWDPRTGHCPTIKTILAIVNPAIEAKFQDYRDTLPFIYRGTKRYFHGTKLKCQMNEYQTFCNNSGCGMCRIAKRGFVSKRIYNALWKHQKQAFFFAPNSSKSHDYCLAKGSNPNLKECPLNGSYWGMLRCEVAPGRKYSFRPNSESQPAPKEPPEGYDSLYGKRNCFFLKSDLSYDELAVFNENAILPRHIILYSYTAN